MKFTGERFIPEFCDFEMQEEHYSRYFFAKQFVENKVVLDAACGEGYGTNILAEVAKNVYGLDISSEAIENAKSKYKKNNCTFIEGSIAELPFDNKSLDVVVSFETIEHVDENLQISFLKEIKRVLKDDGVLIISTPNKEVYSDKFNYKNEFHIHEFYKDEFTSFLKTCFKNVNYYGQGYEVVNIIGKNSSISSYSECMNHKTDDKYLIAYCSNMDIDDTLQKTVGCVGVSKSKNYNDMMQRILNLQSEEIVRNSHIDALNQEMETARKEIVRLNDEIRKLGKWGNELTEQKEREITELIVQKEQITAELATKQNELNVIKDSSGYKLLLMYYKLRDILVPENSKRRFLAKLTKKVLKNPSVYWHALSLDNIRKLRLYASSMNGADLENKLDCYDNRYNGTEKKDIITQQFRIGEDGEKIYDELVLPVFEEPLVSIIIPVYNQFDYTYLCLKSIIEHTKDISYEVIIADDCSSDKTADISKYIKNAVVVRNEQNLRFLLNCNNAAQYAKGKYIHFLNNDTQVQEDWLGSLVRLIESNDKYGMVGSKLVYPNGKLQEAGGILWRDGSAWNYGHMQDPDMAEYNYVKEADYISGASIMIKADLWKEIGGFDKDLAPAYYEDTDLAFEVRKHGYKVMYQPKSVVVHFEGVSNGTNTSSGQKQYQIVNQKKFYNKWKAVLEAEHLPNAQDVFKAKDKSIFKKHILVVDHYVPNYDKDAGGRCTWMYIKLFVKLGLKVTFIGDNYYKQEPYATELTQMGVEFLYGDWYYTHHKEWLKENAHYFDYAYLNRPHITEKYIDLLREHSRCKIIYFGHDLHYLREYREYKITNNENYLASSKQWKKREFSIFGKADIIYAVGSYEQEIIQKEFPDKTVRNIPLYIYEGLKPDCNEDIKSRRDILFVGGFGHPPNEDAVLWFANNAFNKIKESIPDIKWYIVGSHPTDAVKALQSKNIIITGFVSDEELEKLYAKCRITVVPLRYGAGVKGKVVEAAYNRIPLVTTPIGAEGLSLEEQAFEVYDCDDYMAEKIVSLYNDEARLQQLSVNSIEFIKKYFTIDTASKLVLEDIDPSGKA